MVRKHSGQRQSKQSRYRGGNVNTWMFLTAGGWRLLHLALPGKPPPCRVALLRCSPPPAHCDQSGKAGSNCQLNADTSSSCYVRSSGPARMHGNIYACCCIHESVTQESEHLSEHMQQGGGGGRGGRDRGGGWGACIMCCTLFVQGAEPQTVKEQKLDPNHMGNEGKHQSRQARQ